MMMKSKDEVFTATTYWISFLAYTEKMILIYPTLLPLDGKSRNCSKVFSHQDFSYQVRRLATINIALTSFIFAMVNSRGERILLHSEVSFPVMR